MRVAVYVETDKQRGHTRREPLEKLVLPQFAHARRAYSRAVLQNFTILRVVVGWLVDG